MKHYFFYLVLFLGFIACNPSTSKNTTLNESAKTTPIAPAKNVVLSPPKTTSTTFANHSITIDYAAPSIRGRIIFGGTIPFNKVWQAGAGHATWIHTPVTLYFDQGTLPAGKYGIFMIPSTTDWIVIFNSHWDQNGKDEYNPKDDVLRLHLKPLITHALTEQLVYEVKKNSDTIGSIHFAWETAVVDLDFTLGKPQ